MLQRSDLWSLEDYAVKRDEFRAEVLAHKTHRRVRLGEHIVLLFEDTTTIKYQVQEMLRIEKIFEADGIQEELDAYNPLIPDGNNWKCSMLIQYEDVEERRRRLTELLGIEDKIWLEVAGCERVWPIADEDIDRANEEKTAAVHFMRYQLSDAACEAVRNGAAITLGVDHLAYPSDPVTVSEDVRAALAADIS